MHPRSTLTAQRHGPVGQALLLQGMGHNQERTVSLTENEFSGDHKQELAPENATAHEVPRGISWDFSKVSLFPPDRASRTQASSPLPGIVQSKLVVGEINDPLEHEAEHVADQVMRIPIHPPAAGMIQKKLAISQPGDEYEREAEHVAEQVMRMSAQGTLAGTASSSAVSGVQRNCSCGGTCGDCRKNKYGRLQSKRVSVNSLSQAEAPPVVDKTLRSSGQPLDPAVRAFMEPRFGHDFSRVRVHCGTIADQSARGVNAHAYTRGHNIVFAAGQYAPGTRDGNRLLAHELTHVLQQGFGRQQGVLQRDDKPLIPARKPGGSSDLDATVKNIESVWRGVAAIAIPYPELKQWVAQGDTVVALIQTHVGAALNAISAKNDILFAEYELVLESDKVMYDFISWHAVAYANLLSLRSGIDGLINAFDHDSDVGFGLHYFRKFTGRANAERIARELKKAVDGVPANSANQLGLVRTDIPLTLQSISQPITVTSAQIPATRAIIMERTRAAETLQVNIQRGVDYENQLLDGAFKEGGQQAIDNVKEYYALKKSIEKKDPKEKTGEAPEPHQVPVPSPSPDEEEKKKKRHGTMRHQIQQGDKLHFASLAVTALDNNGVTGLQLRTTMAANFDRSMSITRGEQPVSSAGPKVPSDGKGQSAPGSSRRVRLSRRSSLGAKMITGGNIRALQRCFDPKTGSTSGCATNDVRLDVKTPGVTI